MALRIPLNPLPSSLHKSHSQPLLSCTRFPHQFGVHFLRHRVACNCRPNIEIETSKIVRKLIKQGIDPAPKTVHHLRKKEILKVKRKLKKEREKAAKLTKQYTWSDVYSLETSQRLSLEEAAEEHAGAFLCFIHDNQPSGSAENGHTRHNLSSNIKKEERGIRCRVGSEVRSREVYTLGTQDQKIVRSQLDPNANRLSQRIYKKAVQSKRLEVDEDNTNAYFTAKQVQLEEEGLAKVQGRESSEVSRERLPNGNVGRREEMAEVGKRLEERISVNTGDKVGRRKIDGLHMVLEDKKIQLLTDRLNKADYWTSKREFSKLMQSGRLKLTEDRVLRIVQILGEMGNWRCAMQVVFWLHGRQRHWNYKSRYVYTTMLCVLRDAHRPVEALKLFNEMQESFSSYPDMAAYHCIAVILGQAGHLHELLELIEALQTGPVVSKEKPKVMNCEASLSPDIVVYNAVINACVPLKEWRCALWTWNQMDTNCISPNSATYGLMMEVMVKTDKYDQVLQYYNQMQKAGLPPNASTYKSLVEALGKSGHVDEASRLVEQMEHSGLAGSSSVLFSLACSLCTAGRWQEALLQVTKMQEFSCRKSDVITYTGLIQACKQAGHVHDAISLFDHVKLVSAPNVCMCNVMINIYGKNDMFKSARALYEAMKKGWIGNHKTFKSEDRLAPDFFTYQAMLGACAVSKEWDFFESVYREMALHGHHLVRNKHLWLVIKAAREGKDRLVDHMLHQLEAAGEVLEPRLYTKLIGSRVHCEEYKEAID